jgi:hypothetical protein
MHPLFAQLFIEPDLLADMDRRRRARQAKRSRSRRLVTGSTRGIPGVTWIDRRGASRDRQRTALRTVLIREAAQLRGQGVRVAATPCRGVDLSGRRRTSRSSVRLRSAAWGAVNAGV